MALGVSLLLMMSPCAISNSGTCGVLRGDNSDTLSSQKLLRKVTQQLSTPLCVHLCLLVVSRHGHTLCIHVVHPHLIYLNLGMYVLIYHAHYYDLIYHLVYYLPLIWVILEVWFFYFYFPSVCLHFLYSLRLPVWTSLEETDVCPKNRRKCQIVIVHNDH